MVRRGSGLRQRVVGVYIVLLMVKCTIGKNNSVVFRLLLSFKVLNWKGGVSNLKCDSCLSICLKTEKNQ